MKFSEAMEEMKKGNKVTRKEISKRVYFTLGKNENGEELIISNQSKLSTYQYDQSIVMSDGWLLDGGSVQQYFYDIVEKVKQGKRAKMKHWEDGTYIFYDAIGRDIVLHQMDTFPWSLSIDDFLANDWIVI